MMYLACKALILSVLALLRLQAADAAAAHESLKLNVVVNSHGPEKDERMQKVIAALTDILTNTEAEERAEAGNYKCFVDWCQTTGSTLESSLEQVSGELQVKQASVTQVTANIAHLQQELDDASIEIQEVSNMMEQSKNIREEDNEKYTEDLATNRQSISQVTHAIEIVGDVHGQGGFLQNGVLRRLQLNAPGESDYILGVMKGLKANLEKTGKELEAVEHTKQQQYDSLMATKGAQLKSLQDEKLEKTSTLQSKRMTMVSDEHDVARLSKFQAELQEQHQDVQGTCHKKNAEWKIRSDDRAQEKEALRQAIIVLKESLKDSSLVQENQGEADDSELSFMQDSDVSLIQLQALSGSVDAQVGALLAEVTTKNKGNFDEAKKVVTELLALLQNQEDNEAAKHKYCKKGLATKDIEERNTQDEIEGLNATILQQEADIATLVQEINDLNEAIANDKTTLVDATKIRKQEKEAYVDATKDRTLSLKVMAQAKKILSEFYATQDHTGFIQAREKKQAPSNSPPPTWTRSTRSSLESMNVLEIIDKIADDMRIEQKDASAEEKESEAAYDKLVTETQEAFDQRMEEITTRTKRKAKLGVQQNNDQETLLQTKQDLSSIHAEQTSLHDECDDLVQHFDQRVKARRFEMDQLHDVYDILSGSEIAARTGLMQKANKLSPLSSWAAQQKALLVGEGF